MQARDQECISLDVDAIACWECNFLYHDNSSKFQQNVPRSRLAVETSSSVTSYALPQNATSSNKSQHRRCSSGKIPFKNMGE